MICCFFSPQSASRLGAGKSQISRRAAKILCHLDTNLPRIEIALVQKYVKLCHF
jgi:tRNA A37 threonylcarbamoyladenosine biosynthesis protein TsaE